jgi:NADH-quinone oxidoreductase subunit M
MIGGFSILNLIIAFPILGALGCLFGLPARRTAQAVSLLTLGCAAVVAALFANGSRDGFQFVNSLSILPLYDIKYLVGVDGLGIVMILLASVVLVSAIWTAQTPDTRAGLFYACLLFIAAGAIGAFASLDIFVLYAFHELALIPTFLLIGIWGTGNKSLAAWRATIYLGAGSFVLLIGLVALYLNLPEGQRTFDLTVLLRAAPGSLVPVPAQEWIFLLLLAGFGSLVSLFPLHSWAPSAYASAPPPAAMLHAGVLKKFGLFGLIRIALPLVPAGFEKYAVLLLVLLAANILFIGLATVAQKSLDMTLGYSSVMHMGYIFLGLAAGNAAGISGAILLMVAHGLSVALLFGLSGEIRNSTGTLRYNELGGLASVLPALGLAFGIGTFASIGLPGLANFTGELLVFIGAFSEGYARNWGLMIGVTVVALFGVLLSAVYMLRAYRAIFMGETVGVSKSTRDLPVSPRIAACILVASLLAIGFWPRLVLDLIQPAINALALR